MGRAKHLLLAFCLCLVARPALAQETKTPTPVEKVPKEAVPQEPDTTADDEKVVRDVGVGVEGPALLEYFRKRTFPDTNPQQLDRLIDDLGHDEFDVRETAFTRLSGMGAAAMVGLKKAEESPRVEVRLRVAELKRRIEAKAEPIVQMAAARLIARAKPADAAAVLLAYLPFAAEQSVIEEIGKTLGAVAVRQGKIEPALVEALGDPLPLKRGIAGEAIARAGARDQLDTLRKLLKDSDATVRLRVSLAMLTMKDKTLGSEVLPILVDLLGELNADQLWPVEEVLVRLAGDKAPSVGLGNTPEGRKAAHAAWLAWLKSNQDKIDLARLQEPETTLGYTLLVQQVNNIVGGVRRFGGEVLEIDQHKKTRWKFPVTSYPVDAQVVGPDRVLIAEYQGGQVSERDFKGNVHWRAQINGNPIGVQRLPGGNTFVVTQNRLVEVDRDGKETFSLTRQQHDIFRARKLRNGDVIYITNVGILTRVEPKEQKVVKTFRVGLPSTLFGGIDLLPNGHYLVPDFQGNRVVEYDGDGKQVNQINVQWPNSARRLPNGHTLVASQNSRRVIEFDRTGREVWAFPCDGAVFNAGRR